MTISSNLPGERAEPVPEEMLDASHAEALVRVIERAPQVRRRHHFFLWTQGPMQRLLPHSIAICGTYHRHSKELAFEAFHSIAVAQRLLTELCEPRSSLQQVIQSAWVAGRGRALLFDIDSSTLAADATVRLELFDAGYRQLLVHGVARPQRANEIESFFMLATPERAVAQHELLYFDLLLPHLHRAYLRVQSIERELSTGAAVPQEKPPATQAAGITLREKQILRWVRDGKNNHQIGEVLNISPLTVKNHIQKILRKLEAANRAQAVAKALALNLLASVGSVETDLRG